MDLRPHPQPRVRLRHSRPLRGRDARPYHLQPLTEAIMRIARRKFIEGVAVAAGSARLGMSTGRAQTLQGPQFDLTIGSTPVNYTGRARTATTVNGSVPGPILRMPEGETVTINVRNTLREPTSIHCHGILLPNPMDGVPGLTFRGIMPGETFTYRFPVRQSGTYWYPSHTGIHDQTSPYAPPIPPPPG